NYGVFVACYFAAREASITTKNTTSGWKSAGLWPVSSRRPLSNFLVSKASSTHQEDQQSSQPRSQQLDEAASIVPWSTPHRSADLRHQLHQLVQLGKDGLDTHTLRRPSRKMQKSWDNQASRLVLLKQQFQHIQAHLDNQRQRKRKKVPLSPNSRFAAVAHIQQARQSPDDSIDSLD
ncbi:transposase, partial [Colletotrichum graminicola M1.001]